MFRALKGPISFPEARELTENKKARENSTILRLLAEWHPVDQNHLEWLKACSEALSVHHKYCNYYSCNHWVGYGAFNPENSLQQDKQTPALNNPVGACAKTVAAYF